MEESKKKLVMVVVIAACLVAAGMISYLTHSTRSSGIDSIGSDEMYWLKCRNPDCEHAWQMSKKKYLKYQKEQLQAKGFGIYAVPCPKCGEESGYLAEKCPKCGAVFELGSVPDDLEDKCPECGYSETESKREAR